METSVLELKTLIEGFKLSCQTEGKSPKTIEWYITFLIRFRSFLESNDFPNSVNSLNKTHIRAFIRYLQDEARTPRSNRQLSQSTVQGYVRTLKAFFSWLVREEYLKFNPMSNIPVPKATYKVVNTFSQEHITRLFALCRNSNGLGCRNLAIILLLLDSGITVVAYATFKGNQLYKVRQACFRSVLLYATQVTASRGQFQTPYSSMYL